MPYGEGDTSGANHAEYDNARAKGRSYQVSGRVRHEGVDRDACKTAGQLKAELKSANERLTATRNLLESQDQAVGALRQKKAELEVRIKQLEAGVERKTSREVLDLRMKMDELTKGAGRREAELVERLNAAVQEAHTSKSALAAEKGDVNKMRQEAVRRGQQLAESRKAFDDLRQTLEDQLAASRRECDDLRQNLQEKAVPPAPPPSSRGVSRPRSRSRPRTSISSGSQVEDLAPLATADDDSDDDIIILDEDPSITSRRAAPPTPKAPPPAKSQSSRKRSRAADAVEEDVERLKTVARKIVVQSYSIDNMCKFCL